jgi:hypothetical protein
VITGFVELKAVDWSIQAAKFPHLASINFPKPFIDGKCHILLGNNNHHMSAPIQKVITATDILQSYPYASLTPLGWCAAGPTLLPVRDDMALNLLVKTTSAKCTADYSSSMTNAQEKAAKRKK